MARQNFIDRSPAENAVAPLRGLAARYRNFSTARTRGNDCFDDDDSYNQPVLI